MAHKKAGGSTSLGRDSKPKYLGIKLQAGQRARPGSILVRQRGTKIHPGKNVRRGGDDTLYSAADGIIRFQEKKARAFDGKLARRKFVHVV